MCAHRPVRHLHGSKHHHLNNSHRNPRRVLFQPTPCSTRPLAPFGCATTPPRPLQWWLKYPRVTSVSAWYLFLESAACCNPLCGYVLITCSPTTGCCLLPSPPYPSVNVLEVNTNAGRSPYGPSSASSMVWMRVVLTSGVEGWIMAKNKDRSFVAELPRSSYGNAMAQWQIEGVREGDVSFASPMRSPMGGPRGGQSSFSNNQGSFNQPPPTQRSQAAGGTRLDMEDEPPLVSPPPTLAALCVM